MLACRRKPLVVLLLLLVALGAPPVATAALEGSSAQSAALTWRDRLVLNELNRVRKAHGLPLLRVDARLQSAARAHSRDMARRGYFSHGDFAGRMQRYGVQGRAAENIAWAAGRNRAKRIVGMWMRSPGHRANVLRRGFRRVGVAGVVGRLYGRSNAMVVTADFAGR